MIKEFIKKHERKLSAFALFVGFSWDAFTLTRIDYFFEVLVLGTHASLIVLWILLSNIIEGKKLTGWFFGTIVSITPLLMQVSFGALFSALTIFYIKSASLTTTLVFVGILAGLLIGNEFFKNKYQKFVFQFSILFVALTAFFALYIPVLVGAVGAWVFILANVVAALTIFILVGLLKFLVPNRVGDSEKNLRISVISIFVLFQILYFSNIIPPVPLALKDKGVYLDVYRSGDSYFGLSEKKTFFENIFSGNTVHFREGDSISVYSSVFAPSGISTDITHAWEYFDTRTNTWVSLGKIPFSISGGRGDGFRGYTEKTSVFEGKWRVFVLTKRNQVLGRIYFTLEKTEETLELIDKKL